MVTRAASLFVVLLVAPGVLANEVAPARPRVAWSAEWPRFRLSEYGASAVLGAASLYLHYDETPPAQEKWQGNNFLDETTRGWLRAETPEGRARAGEISDLLWWGGTAMPFVVDLPVVLLAHRQPQVAWQLLMMDLEANAVAGFINNALFYEVGRGRPDHPDCAVDPSYDPLCGGPSNNAGFPSGHTLGIATAAGLTCVHHRYLPLYGSPAADAGACVLMSLAIVATGVTRIMSDRHYASDVLAGAAIGFASGYGLPWFLHYRARSEIRDPSGTHWGCVAVVPFGGPREAGVGLVGAM